MKVWYRGDRSGVMPVTICPAAHLGGVLPESWYEGGRPKTFEVEFRYGVAEVSDEIGRYLVAQNIASRTSLILPR